MPRGRVTSGHTQAFTSYYGNENGGKLFSHSKKFVIKQYIAFVDFGLEFGTKRIIKHSTLSTRNVCKVLNYLSLL